MDILPCRYITITAADTPYVLNATKRNGRRERNTMERDKAIKMLKNRDACGFVVGFTSGLNDVFDMALKSMEMEDFIYNWLAQAFNAPCGYSFNGYDIAQFMGEECGSWCDDCENHSEVDCWRKFFERYKEYVDSWNTERIGE